jgi:cytochrome P450
MTDQPASLSFPTPYGADERQSTREIAASLRDNALAGLPSSAFEELAVDRSFLGRRQIILNDPAAIRHVLIENADNYRRTATVYRLLDPVIGRGMLLADGGDWREQRRAAAPAFAPRAIGSITGHIARGGERMLADLQAARGANIDLFAQFQMTTLEIAATALFSLELGAEGTELRSELARYGAGVGRPSVLDFLVPRGLPVPRTFARWRFRRRWMALMARLVAARRAAPGGARGDLFDMMAEQARSERQLVEEVATVLVAGHETTAVALFWTCTMLAEMPAVQDEIAAEAAALDLSPEGAVAAAPALVYTRAVIDEGLRLYPPAFSITRQARTADDAAGVAIPAAGVVLIVPWVLHRHVKLWSDPNRFDPRRFLPGAAPPARFSYLPFGAGPRACIGAQFALTEATIVLAQLLRAFRLELADAEPVLPLATITLRPYRSPPFRLTPRE